MYTFTLDCDAHRGHADKGLAGHQLPSLHVHMFCIFSRRGVGQLGGGLGCVGSLAIGELGRWVLDASGLGCRSVLGCCMCGGGWVGSFSGVWQLAGR